MPPPTPTPAAKPAPRLAQPPKHFRLAQPPGPPKPPPEPPDLETYAEAGDVVDWFPATDRNEAPQTGVVTQLGNDTKVAVNVFHPALAYTVCQDGCYHIDHPKAQIDLGPGGWRHKPMTVAARRLLLKAGLLRWNEDCSRLVVNPAAVAEGPAEEPKPAA